MGRHASRRTRTLLGVGPPWRTLPPGPGRRHRAAPRPTRVFSHLLHTVMRARWLYLNGAMGGGVLISNADRRTHPSCDLLLRARRAPASAGLLARWLFEPRRRSTSAGGRFAPSPVLALARGSLRAAAPAAAPGSLAAAAASSPSRRRSGGRCAAATAESDAPRTAAADTALASAAEVRPALADAGRSGSRRGAAECASRESVRRALAVSMGRGARPNSNCHAGTADHVPVSFCDSILSYMLANGPSITAKTRQKFLSVPVMTASRASTTSSSACTHERPLRLR